MREGLIAFLQCEHPDALPRVRAELDARAQDTGPKSQPATPPLRAGKGDSSAIKEPSHAQDAGDRHGVVEMHDGVTGKGG